MNLWMLTVITHNYVNTIALACHHTAILFTSDLVLLDYSASRVHARIVQENEVFYLEDLNSTNGTYKNGLRMQPYEKRKLESGDELKFGKTEYIYR